MFTVYKVDGDGELVCSGCVWNVWNVCVWLIWLCVHCVNTNPMFPSLDTVCEGVDVWVFAIFPPFVLHLPQVVSH